MERRRSKRTLIDLMINKYIDGYPYMCRAINISRDGLLVERIREPRHDRTSYPVEIGVPGSNEGIWAWTRQVRSSGQSQALRFVAMDPFDRLLLDQYIDNKS